MVNASDIIGAVQVKGSIAFHLHRSARHILGAQGYPDLLKIFSLTVPVFLTVAKVRDMGEQRS